MDVKHLKIAALVLLTALVVIFVMQNLEAVDIRFLFWSFAMSRALLVMLVLIAGVLIGWLTAAMWRRRHEPLEGPEKTW